VVNVLYTGDSADYIPSWYDAASHRSVYNNRQAAVYSHEDDLTDEMSKDADYTHINEKTSNQKQGKCGVFQQAKIQ
jgi:hypothetical protein